MSNSFFEFKKFKVFHDRCAMKVGTDGVLLGSWACLNNDVKYILDIGTGSGLLSLMLAQRTIDKVQIDAIDIDEGAVIQTLFNIKQSGFSNIDANHISLHELVEKSSKKYDLIVSNPPFFTSSLKSPDSQRNLARHDESLTLRDLLSLSKRILSKTGLLVFIYPFDEKQNILTESEKNGLSVKRITNVCPTPTSKPKRVLIELSELPCLKIEDDLIIEQSRHVYSTEFTALVKDFYLRV